MKPYLFPIRLYPEDHKRRIYLEKTMRDSSGRKMTFAAIIRELIETASGTMSNLQVCELFTSHGRVVCTPRCKICKQHPNLP